MVCLFTVLTQLWFLALFTISGKLAGLGAALLWPYSQMPVGMNSNQSEDGLTHIFTFFIICILYLIGLNLTGILSLKK